MIESLETLKRRNFFAGLKHGNSIAQAGIEAGYSVSEASELALASGYRGKAGQVFSLLKERKPAGCTLLIWRFHLGQYHKVRWIINLTFWRGRSDLQGFQLWCKTAEARKVAA
jgi:hypothetical protein